MLELDPKTTALVLIDLQKGIIGHELTPHRADQVSKVGSTLADTFRKAGETHAQRYVRLIFRRGRRRRAGN